MGMAVNAGPEGDNGPSSGRPRPKVRRFTARQPVRWLAPPEIARGAYGEFFGGLFSRFVDSRDRQAQVRQAEVYHYPGVALPWVEGLAEELTKREIRQLPSVDPNEDVVVDYVADVGDGFGATYAIADLIATSKLGGGPGSLLIMGGDQVYPVAGDTAYGDRTVGPYQLAFRDKIDAEKEAVDTPVFAIPGNHDWYDGLVSFLNRFARNDGDTEPQGSHAQYADPYYETTNLPSVQTRSYFAIALPHNWWIWGVDTGLGVNGRVDIKQNEYFQSISKLLDPEDRIILCNSEPSWLKCPRPVPPGGGSVKAQEQRFKPDWWDNLLTFLQTVLPDTNDGGSSPPAWTDRVGLIISGDKHFYTRHEPANLSAGLPTLVTSGGGGAYLSSTREVPEKFATNMAALSVQHHPYVKGKIWPSKNSSNSIGVRGLFQLPALNPYMAAVIGVIYGLASYSSFTGILRPAFDPGGDQSLNAALAELRAETDIWSIPLLGVKGVAGSFAAFTLAVIVVGILLAFAWSAWTSTSSRILAAIGHTTLHTVALGVTMWLSLLVVDAEWPLLRNLTEDWGDEWGWLLWLQAIVASSVVAAVIAVPIVARWWKFRVRELRQLLVLLPTALAVAPIPLLVKWDEQFATGTTLAVMGGLIGGACGLVAFAAYLVASQFRNTHLNELFVGLRVEDYKQFLRLRITTDGLKASAIGYEKVNSRTVHWDEDGTPILSDPRRPQEEAIAFDTFSVPKPRL